jgi:hypothetical protein
MIELDYGPVAVGIIIAVAFIGPVIFSFFVDNYDKSGK